MLKSVRINNLWEPCPTGGGNCQTMLSLGAQNLFSSTSKQQPSTRLPAYLLLRATTTAVYPEGVVDNPLGSKHVVQWILYFPEERSIPLFKPSSLIACYSDRICKGFDEGFSRIRMRAVDYGLENFENLPRPKERAGTVLYAWKSHEGFTAAADLPPSLTQEGTSFFNF